MTDVPATELQPASDVDLVPHPRDGEMVAVDSLSTDLLAELRDALIAADQQRNAQKAIVDREIVKRLDHEGRRSAEVGAFKVTAPAPTKTVWDGNAAWRALRRLVREGIISQDVMKRAVEVTVDRKPIHGELKKLLAHADARVRDAVAACQSIEDVDSRRVSVQRLPGKEAGE